MGLLLDMIFEHPDRLLATVFFYFFLEGREE
jgi:hypothetical protein